MTASTCCCCSGGAEGGCRKFWWVPKPEVPESGVEEKAGNDHPGPPPTTPVVGPFAAAAPGACSNKGPNHMPCSIAQYQQQALPKQTTARHLSKMVGLTCP